MELCVAEESESDSWDRGIEGEIGGTSYISLLFRVDCPVWQT